MPAKSTIYNIDGSTAEVYAVDARQAVTRHPEQWSFTRFPKAEVEAAKKKAEEAAEKLKTEMETVKK